MPDTEKPLFKPLAEGLGFHPYTDGLPYAPTSKISQSLKTPPRPDVLPGASTLQRPVSNDLWKKQLSTQSTSAPLSIQNGLAVEQAMIQPPAFTKNEVRFKDFLIRAFASMIDYAIAATTAWVIGRFWVRTLNPDLDWISHPGVVAIYSLVFLTFVWAFVALQEIFTRTTFGKKLFGLELRGSRLRIFVRSIAAIFSFAFAGTGLVWALFDSKFRTWHDQITDLQPMRINGLNAHNGSVRNDLR